MRISDLVAKYILDMMEEGDGNAEIKRNELATALGCVPSQINYVITSRFTPEQGFVVESRRGGGGYIRITRIKADRGTTLMHIVSSLGDSIDNSSANIILQNLLAQGVITKDACKLISIAVSDRCYGNIPTQLRDSLRACIFKNMLITQI